MGANDAAEMLEAAKAECLRLERIIAEAREAGLPNGRDRSERLSDVLTILSRA